MNSDVNLNVDVDVDADVDVIADVDTDADAGGTPIVPLVEANYIYIVMHHNDRLR